MIKYAILALAAASLVSCHERNHSRNHHDEITHHQNHHNHQNHQNHIPFPMNYLWPWNNFLQQAASALRLNDYLGKTEIVSDEDKHEVNLNVKRFKPEELKVKVKNHNIIVEGKQKVENSDDKAFVPTYFVRFSLPAGCKQEEVTAVYKDDGTLTISAPKHKLPPPQEREVPIQVLASDKKEEKSGVTQRDKEEYTVTTDKEVKRVKKI